MRCTRRVLDLGTNLAARTEALVDEVAGAKHGERVAVQVEPLALADDVARPVDADGGEIGQLCRLVLRGGLHPVEVLHPDDEIETGRARRQPREERRAQVAQMQRAGWRWREAAAHVSILTMSSHVTPTTRPTGRPPQGGAHDVADRVGQSAGPAVAHGRDPRTGRHHLRVVRTGGRRRTRGGDHRTRRAAHQGWAELVGERGGGVSTLQRATRASHARASGPTSVTDSDGRRTGSG